MSRKRKFVTVQVITLLRIIFASIFFILLLIPFSPLMKYIFCIMLLLLVELTDFLDGLFARKLKVTNEFGALLDPYADSISRIIIYFALYMSNLIYFIVPLIMIIRDITVAYCRLVFALNKKTVSAKISGKIKAVIQAVFSFIILLQPLYWDWTGKATILIFSCILSIVTLFSMIEYFYHAFRLFVAKYHQFYKE